MRPVEPALESQPVAGGAGTLRTVSLLWLYLTCVATCGACVPVWVYRTARALDPAPERKRQHIAWAAGSLMPWIACPLAYELTRLAQAAAPQRAAGAARGPAIAFGVTAALVIVLFGTPLAAFYSLKLLLLPIPVLLCQVAANRSAAASARAPEQEWDRRAVIRATVAVLGLAAVLLVGAIDLDPWQRVTARTYASGAKVTGTSGRYELTLSAGEWRRVRPGTFGDPDTELELERTDQAGTNWLVAYVDPEGTMDLDSRVAARRAVIEEAAARVTAVKEKRYFVDADTFAVASLAQYEAVIARARTHFWVLSTIAHGFSIELVAHSDAAAPDERAILEILQDVTLVDRGATAP